LRALFVGALGLLALQVPLRRITEPYPAILFPAGASLLHDTGSYTSFENEYVAIDAAGAPHPFALAALLDTVPAVYRSYVVERGFGLTEDRDIRRVHGHVLGRPLTGAQRDATRAWLRAKLARVLGVDAVQIRIDTFAVTTRTDDPSQPPQRRLDRQHAIDLLTPRGPGG